MCHEDGTDLGIMMIFSNDHLRDFIIRDSDEAQEMLDDDSDDASASLD